MNYPKQPKMQKLKECVEQKSDQYANMLMRFRYYSIYLQARENNMEEYSSEITEVLLYVLCHYKQNCKTISKKQFYQFAQTYSLKNDINKFGEKGKKVAYKEIQ